MEICERNEILKNQKTNAIEKKNLLSGKSFSLQKTFKRRRLKIHKRRDSRIIKIWVFSCWSHDWKQNGGERRRRVGRHELVVRRVESTFPHFVITASLPGKFGSPRQRLVVAVVVQFGQRDAEVVAQGDVGQRDRRRAGLAEEAVADHFQKFPPFLVQLRDPPLHAPDLKPETEKTDQTVQKSMVLTSLYTK